MCRRRKSIHQECQEELQLKLELWEQCRKQRCTCSESDRQNLVIFAPNQLEQIATTFVLQSIDELRPVP